MLFAGKRLVKGRDFTVSYKNNRKIGVATMIIKGKGNFTGTLKRTFRITDKPIIAVPSFSYGYASGLISWLKKHGFRCVVIKTANVNTKRFDGVAIPGGVSDVAPALYGEKNKYARSPNAKLDKMQFAAIKKFAAANKPVLGICKGCQLINVAYGGSLYQDLGGYHRRDQKTTIRKNSWLYSLYGTNVTMYHYHHQAAKRLGKGLIATAWSKKDGKTIIEAIEHKKLPVWGIQFHPEYSGAKGNKILAKYRWECGRRM